MCVCVRACVSACVSVAIAIAKRPVLPLYVEDRRCSNFLYFCVLVPKWTCADTSSRQKSVSAALTARFVANVRFVATQRHCDRHLVTAISGDSVTTSRPPCPQLETNVQVRGDDFRGVLLLPVTRALNGDCGVGFSHDRSVLVPMVSLNGSPPPFFFF